MLIRRAASAIVLASATSALGFACAGSGDTESAVSAHGGPTRLDAGGLVDGGDGGCPEPKFERNACSDGQSAAILIAANEGEIRISAVGIERGTDPRVVAFAEAMVEEHTALGEEAAALLAELRVRPEPNDTSQTLEAQAEDEREALEALPEGEEFDRRFVAVQLIAHLKVLGHLDELLIPSARNDAYRDTLRAVREHVATHARRVFDLQSQLVGRCGTAPPDAGPDADGGPTPAPPDAGPGPEAPDASPMTDAGTQPPLDAGAPVDAGPDDDDDGAPVMPPL